MEKTYTRPAAREIAIKGPAADGHADAFSYDPTNADDRTLGHLFIVGNVAHDTDDMAYAINLISALAKREYYARRDLSPREAFTATLRKVNEVVEEFFKNKGLTLNVGIFAIAGEQMLISKLGKFKVLLARDQRSIDVLNNVDLFNKELTQEKQFSNIISGKVAENDRIFAFYPSRGVVARERFLKNDFLKLGQDAFVEKLQTIKTEKDSFGCAALYITFETVTEQAPTARATPHELASAATLTSDREETAGQPVRTSRSTARKATLNEPKPAATPVPAVSLVGTAGPSEMPHIIPSEFSLGRKTNPLALFIRRMALPRLSRRTKLIAAGACALLVVAALVAVKATFMPSAAEREAQAKITEAQAALVAAQEKISQNDQVEARNLLTRSLAAIGSLTEPEKIIEVRADLTDALDTLDHAENATAHVLVQISADAGQVRSIALAGNIPNILAAAKDGAANVLTIENGSVSKMTALENRTATTLLSGKDSTSLLDIAANTLTTVKDGKAIDAKLGVTEPIAAAALYEDNLYAVIGTVIKKIADAAIGETKASDWLKTGTVDGEVMGVAVDGSVYVLASDGTLTTYFRGERTSSVKLPLAPIGMKMVTAGENPNLYFIDRTMSRVYLVDKKLGSIVRTLKLASSDIIDATVDEGGTIYYITGDNKLWKTE